MKKVFLGIVLLVTLSGCDDPRRWGRDGRDLRRVDPRTGEVYYLREFYNLNTGEFVGTGR